MGSGEEGGVFPTEDRRLFLGQWVQSSSPLTDLRIAASDVSLLILIALKMLQLKHLQSRQWEYLVKEVDMALSLSLSLLGGAN